MELIVSCAGNSFSLRRLSPSGEQQAHASSHHRSLHTQIAHGSPMRLKPALPQSAVKWALASFSAAASLPSHCLKGTGGRNGGGRGGRADKPTQKGKKKGSKTKKGWERERGGGGQKWIKFFLFMSGDEPNHCPPCSEANGVYTQEKISPVQDIPLWLETTTTAWRRARRRRTEREGWGVMQATPDWILCRHFVKGNTPYYLNWQSSDLVL